MEENNFWKFGYLNFEHQTNTLSVYKVRAASGLVTVQI